jgi:hypothetical protein
MKFSTKLHGVTFRETVILKTSVDIGPEREVNPFLLSLMPICRQKKFKAYVRLSRQFFSFGIGEV